jgi:Domain of unknown function (DUF4263)
VKRERKTVELKFEGSAPMSLVEVGDGPIIPWTPNQDQVVQKIRAAIQAFLKQTESLAAGKYAHLRSMIPDYLTSPGNVLIFVCNDGVVIRFEKKSDEKRKLLVAMHDQDIAHAAELLSQRLICVTSSEHQSGLDDAFGVELKLYAHAPSEGPAHEMLSTRIWFQVVNAQPPDLISPAAKPHCLLSVNNHLDLELVGELITPHENAAGVVPFVVRSSLRLAVGWDCIEVYPGLDLTLWKEEFAPLWAENAILGAAVVSQTRDAELRNLDPRAATRRQYAALLVDFKKLLDTDPEREETLQAFLKDNPALLCPAHVRMWPKLALGAKITDFVFRDATNDYLLVELERSTLPLFRQDGHPTAELTHAQSQITDWKRYLEDNIQTVQRELGLDGITPNPSGLVVIGRSQSLIPANRRKLQTMMNESPKLRILTYDDVYANANAVLENLLGPMWDPGGTTQIFCPCGTK